MFFRVLEFCGANIETFSEYFNIRGNFFCCSTRSGLGGIIMVIALAEDNAYGDLKIIVRQIADEIAGILGPYKVPRVGIPFHIIGLQRL